MRMCSNAGLGVKGYDKIGKWGGNTWVLYCKLQSNLLHHLTFSGINSL